MTTESRKNVKIPETVERIISDFDASLKSFAWSDLQSELSKARSALGEGADKELDAGAWCEIAAWALQAEVYEPWNTYFGPLGSSISAQGETTFFPNVRDVSTEMLDHWIIRAKTVKHPTLRARYNDLAWELAPKIDGRKRNYKHALNAIDAYLEANAAGLLEFHDQVIQVSRALDLACSIRDDERRNGASSALLVLHDKAISIGQFWWRTFDRLIHKSSGISTEAHNRLIQSLEYLAEKYAKTDGSTFNPHHLKDIVERLNRLHSKAGNRTASVRLHEIVGQAFEFAASRGNSMQATSFFQMAENSYQDAGLDGAAKRVRLERTSAIQKSHSEMQTITVEHTINLKDIDAFLAAIIGDKPGSSFARIASHFVWRIEDLEQLLKEISKSAPLFVTIPVAVMAADHQAASVGGIDDDLDGRLCQQAIQSIQLSSIFLSRALDTVIDRFDLSPYEFVGFASRSGLFTDLTFLLEGISAWFNGDHCKSIFVLTPQIERGLRQLTGNLGEPVTRRHPTMADREVSIGMGEIFGNAVVKEALGADLLLYFKAIYSDPRGLNLRNDVAHGLLDRGMVNSVISNLLIHTLLVLGLWKELAEHRKAEKVKL